MGFRGVLPPRETGGARALPETRDAEEQLHPVPAEGVFAHPMDIGSHTPSSGRAPSQGLLLRHESSVCPGLNKIFSFGWCLVGEVQLLGGEDPLHPLPYPQAVSEVLK